MTTVDNITAASVLLAAIDYCDEYGWKRGAEGLDGHPRCMIGAVESVRAHQNGFLRSDINSAVYRVEGQDVVAINDGTNGGWSAVKTRFLQVVDKLLG